MSRQELIWQARAHKCSSRSPLRRLGRRPSRGFERTNDENTVLDCVFISLPLFYIKRAMFNVTDVGISYKKKSVRMLTHLIGIFAYSTPLSIARRS